MNWLIEFFLFKKLEHALMTGVVILLVVILLCNTYQPSNMSTQSKNIDEQSNVINTINHLKIDPSTIHRLAAESLQSELACAFSDGKPEFVNQVLKTNWEAFGLSKEEIEFYKSFSLVFKIQTHEPLIG